MLKIYIFLFVLVLATTPLPVCARADAAPHAAQSAPSGNGGLGDQLRQFKGYPHLDMAYRKMRAGENSAAAEEFRQYLTIIPQDAKARADFMNLLYRMGEYDAALALLQGQPDTQKIFALQQTRGMVLVKLGDNDQALAAFATALDAAGTDAERIAALRALVLVGKQDGDEEDVARYLTQARALAPDDEDLLREQALFYEHKGNYKEAVRLSARLEKLHPGPENAAVLANSLFLASRYAEAAAVYAEIAAKEPQMLYRAGQSFAAAHQEQQAIDMFTAFLRTGVSPLRKAETLLALGNIYATQGDAPQAYAAFHEAAPLAAALPQKAQAQLAAGLAFAAMGSGKPAEAVAPLQTALRLAVYPGEKVSIFMQLAQAHAALGDTAKAAEAWRQAAACPGAAREDVALAEESLGYALTDMGDYVGAERAFGRALEAAGPRRRIVLAAAHAAYAAGLYEKALEHFAQAAAMHPTTDTSLALGRTYEKLGKPGLALVNYRQAAQGIAAMSQEEQRKFYLSLGFLQMGQADYAAAAEAFGQALTLGYDPATAARLGHAELLAGQTEAARQTFAAMPDKGLPVSVQVQRLVDLASIAIANGQYEEAEALVAASLRLKKDAALFSRQGDLLRRLQRTPEAIAAYREALRMDNTAAGQAALGYALSDAGQYAAAADAFEQALAADPDAAHLWEDLGYASMHEVRNAQSVAAFKKAIDAAVAQGAETGAEQVEIDKKIFRLRREVTKLQTNLSATAYLSYLPDGAGPSRWAGGDTARTIRSGGGAEVAWTPPVLGLRDDRLLQVIGRVSANLNEDDSFSFDEDSWQGAVGLCYKPFKSQNFNVGAERLFHLGDKAEDTWLLRAMYSWTDGYDLSPGVPYWNYTFFFGEYDYYTSENARSVVYGEVRQGMTFNVYDRFLVTPHVVADSRITEPDRDQTSLVEFGAGLSLRFFLPAFNYEVPRSSVEVLLQYKRGTLFHVQGDDKNSLIDSLFLTTSITF